MRTGFERKKGKSGRVLAGATVLVIILIAADFFSHGALRSKVRSLEAFIAPKIGAVHAGTIVPGSTKNLGDAASYKLRAAGYDALEAENAHLRALVHLAAKEPGTTAPIVSSLQSSPYGTFTIGAGEAEGVAKNDIVLTDGGFVLGTVVDVGSHTALVRAVFAPDASTDVVVGSIAAVASGQGGGNAEADVPRESAIATGTPVTAPAYGGKPVGIVGRVESDPAQAQATVYIAFPVNISLLQYVYVIHHS